MNFEITDSGPKLTVREISAYEAGAQVHLPPQFRNFLLQSNGGIPSVMVAPDTGFDADVSVFFQLFTQNRKDSLEDLSGKCGKEIIWFAADSGGGRFGIAHAGQNFGCVYWFDLPHSDVTDPLEADCAFVASTFNAFLNSLTPFS